VVLALKREPVDPARWATGTVGRQTRASTWSRPLKLVADSWDIITSARFERESSVHSESPTAGNQGITGSEPINQVGATEALG
jgi:endo-1,4-beta-mannosidase